MRREIDLIVLHCSATRPSSDVDADRIRRWHMRDNNWRDIGYHWVIRRSGELETGRDESDPGAHVRGHNANSIGICMVGGIDENGLPDSNFTLEQWNTLRSLLYDVLGRYPGSRIVGHRDLDAGKACPCFDAKVLFHE